MNGLMEKIETVSSNNKAISRASNRVNNKVNNKVSNRANKVRRDSRDHKADSRVVNSKAASSLAARRMAVASETATISARDQTAMR